MDSRSIVTSWISLLLTTLSAFATDLSTNRTAPNGAIDQYGNKPIVAYLSTWGGLACLKDRATADFIFSNITHLAYIGAVSVNTNASLKITDANTFSNIVAITHAHDRKVVITIADGDGSTDNHGKLINICSSAAARHELTTNILRLCRRYNFDGVDLDWEFPPPSAVPSFNLLLDELREASPPGFLISVAVMRGIPAQAKEPVNWFYIMAYTFKMKQCAAELKTWLASGAPRSKLVLGMGLYGQNSSRGTIGYAQLIGTNTIDPKLDSYHGYTFTGMNTVKQLTKYVYDKKLGGIGWFRVELDAFNTNSLMLAGATQARASTHGREPRKQIESKGKRMH